MFDFHDWRIIKNQRFYPKHKKAEKINYVKYMRFCKRCTKQEALFDWQLVGLTSFWRNIKDDYI